MNHDYAHCLDFKPSCPRSCFRARLARDLQTNMEQYIGMTFSYMRFRGSGLCQIEDDEQEGEKE